MQGANLVIAPHEADDHSILLPSLHAVDGTDFKIKAIYGPKDGRQEGDLCLISGNGGQGMTYRRWKMSTHGVMMAI